MSLSLASNPWSASANPSRDGALAGIEVAADAGERRWVLKRNCAVTPAQMGLFYFSLCVVSLGIGTFFALNGAAFVLGFAGLEVVVAPRRCAHAAAAFWMRSTRQVSSTLTKVKSRGSSSLPSDLSFTVRMIWSSCRRGRPDLRLRYLLSCSPARKRMNCWRLTWER